MISNELTDRNPLQEAMPPARPRNLAQTTISREERRQRLRFVMMLLREGRTRGYIASFLKEQYGYKASQASRYVAVAKKQMVAELAQGREDLKAQSYAFYMSVLQDPDTPQRDKIRAREMADRLVGLQAPNKVAQTTADGEDVNSQAVKGLTNDELQVLIKARERLHNIAAGQGPGGGGRN
jgi:hypothetical protein